MLAVAMFRIHDTLSADHINHNNVGSVIVETATLLARFMGPTWGPPGDDRTQVGPMLVPWTLLSGYTYALSLCSYIVIIQERLSTDGVDPLGHFTDTNYT